MIQMLTPTYDSYCDYVNSGSHSQDDGLATTLTEWSGSGHLIREQQSGGDDYVKIGGWFHGENRAMTLGIHFHATKGRLVRKTVTPRHAPPFTTETREWIGSSIGYSPHEAGTEGALDLVLDENGKILEESFAGDDSARRYHHTLRWNAMEPINPPDPTSAR